MANWHTLQNSFIEGEVSPRYVASVDDPAIAEAAAEIRNGLVLLQGDVTKRMGTNFLNDTLVGPSGTARVWPFLALDNNAALTVWTSGLVDVFLNTAAILPRASGTPDLKQLLGYEQKLINPTFTQGLTGWINSGNYTRGKTAYSVVPIGNQLAQMTIEFTKPIDTITPDEPFVQQEFNIDSTTNLIITSRARFLTFNPGTGVVKLKLKIGTTPGGEEVTTETFTLTQVLKNFSESVLIPGGISGQLYATAEMLVEDLTATEFSGVESYSLFLDEFIVYSQTPGPVQPIKLTTPYASRQLESLHFLQSPFTTDTDVAKPLLVFHPDFPPYALYFDGITYVFEEFNFEFPGEGWTPLNQPNIATAFQGRLMVTGAINDPETIWGSKVGEWGDFRLVSNGEDQPVPDDGVIFTPTARGLNTWINGFKRLLFGNTINEYSVDSESGILQPGDIGVLQQSSYGTLRNPQKITIGHSVALPTGANTSLRMIKFNRDDGGFIAPDVLLKAEHLGRKVIRQYFHVRDPHETLWCIMADGSISIMSFDEPLGIYAWSHFQTDGRFVDGCVIVDDLGQTHVVLVVERVIEGVTVKYIESVSDMRDIENWQYMDSHIRILNEGGGTTIGGLSHLEAKEVQVFMDELYMGTRVVVNGTIEIEGPALLVDVGLGYNFRVRTFPQDSLIPDAGLTAKKRFSKIGVRGIFARPPKINGQRPPDRSPQSIMDVPEPIELLMDTDVVDLNWNQTGTVVIEEDLPVRLTVAGIFGKLSSKEV